jgi:Flp pilus assembly pilin Flp
MKKLIAHLVWDDQGQDLIEYVLIGSLVSVAVVIAAGNLGSNLNDWYEAISGWAGRQAANPNLAGS